MARRDEEPRALRIHQSLARQIGTAILTGAYKPGEGLGGEIEQSKAHGVARSVYREAMRILVAKGFIESRPKAGTLVTPRSQWNLLDPDVLAWMFMGQPDERFVRDLFELRGIIEPAAAELAAQRRTDAQLQTMAAALADMNRFGLASEDGQAADQAFHRCILEASGNRALFSLAGSVGAAVQWTTHFKQRVRLIPRDPLPEHEALYEAIAGCSIAGAREATETLLRLALADMTRPQ